MPASLSLAGALKRSSAAAITGILRRMPHIVSIAYTPADTERRPADHYARASLTHAALVAGQGIAGDVKAKAGKRQLNVMLAETVAELRAEGFCTAPGELGEQLVIAGLGAAAIPGARIQLGDSAVIELGELREPCGRFARIQGVPAAAGEGRIGFMARVLVDGEIAVGSPATLVDGSRRAVG